MEAHVSEEIGQNRHAAFASARGQQCKWGCSFFALACCLLAFCEQALECTAFSGTVTRCGLFALTPGLTADMAHNTIHFQNPQTGQTRRAPVGFAWTILLLGPLVFLARKEWLLFAVTLVLTVITLHLSNVFLALKGNRMYIQLLVNSGFRVDRVDHGTVEQMSEALDIQLPTLSSFLFAETNQAPS